MIERREKPSWGKKLFEMSYPNGLLFCEKVRPGDEASWDLSLQVKDHVVCEPGRNCLHSVHTATPVKQLTSDKWCNVSSKHFFEFENCVVPIRH